MSLGLRAVRGALWSTLASIGSRLVGIVGTFVLTRFLAPEVQGEVNVAYIVVATAHFFSSLGMGQWVVANPKADRSATFHASAIYMSAGAVAFALTWLFAKPLASLLNAEAMAQYVPGFVLAHALERVAQLPRNILARELHFRLLGLRMALGEVAYAGASVLFAWWGWGGHAIIAGNVVRALLGVIILCSVVDWRDYALPCRLDRAILRRLLAYGSPMSVAVLFHMGAQTWDNLFIAYRFGEAQTGLYNQAYKLADLPATHIGEQFGDVLVPTFAHLEDDAARKAALTRAAGLLGLVVFPLAIGLGAVAYTLVEAFYPPSYQEVAPFLAVLAVLSVFRPVGVLVMGWLQVVGRTRDYMNLDIFKVVMILGSMALLAPLGPVWSCAGVGIGFALNSLQMVWTLRKDGIAPLSVLRPLAPPLLACLPMAAAVLATRAGLLDSGVPVMLRLLLELLVGAVSYVPSALLIARASSSDFLNLVKNALSRRRG